MIFMRYLYSVAALLVVAGELRAGGGVEIDPAESLTTFTSLAEWDTDADQEGWSGANITGISVSGGTLSGLGQGIDPMLIRGGLGLDSTTGDLQVVEIRMRKAAGETSRVDLFWADGSGGFSAARKVTVPSGAWPGDGEFHVLRMEIDGLLNGTVTSLRLDPTSGLAASEPIEIDYIRIGPCPPPPPPPPLRIIDIEYDELFVEVTISWTSGTNATYRIEANSDLGIGWETVADKLPGDPGTTNYIDGNLPVGATQRFYRVLLLEP